MAPLAPVPRARRPPPDVPVYDVNDSRPASAAPSEHFADPPDVTISTGVGMRGELSFPKLLRVEGHFAGTLTCGGDVVIAPGGTLEADVDNANGYLLVEGTVLGNVNARRVQIAATGRVFGDITCNSFIIAPGAVVIGALLMILADWAGRVVLFPSEIPAGLVATLIGGSYFMWRLRRM